MDCVRLLFDEIAFQAGRFSTQSIAKRYGQGENRPEWRVRLLKTRHAQPKAQVAMEEVLHEKGATAEQCYFWATQSGAELDLLLLQNGKRIGYEFKYTERPKVSPSMRIAKVDLKLDHLYVISPGAHSFPLDDGITAYGLNHLDD